MWECPACRAQMGDFAQICSSCGAARDAGGTLASRSEGYGHKSISLRMLRAMAALWYVWCGLLAVISLSLGAVGLWKLADQRQGLTFFAMSLGFAAMFLAMLFVSRKFLIQPMIEKLEGREQRKGGLTRQ